ncbi:MAG TPA: hypothetical protein VN909_03725 [Candidatus Dormibacteraeota bacterium]|nr:hypothetical protein [Candidatus Dormibacteraeota bacterium]
MSKSEEKSKAASLVTHREFKLLLKPEKFPTRRALLEFNELLAKSAKKLGVRYEPVESLDSQLRIVQFYDTKGEDLRKNKLIFRVRQIRQGGWPDESWELTFKCRAPEYEKAAGFDTDTTLTKLQKKKFKEELVRGDRPGTMESIYSNNVIVEYPEIQVEVPLSRLAGALPHLKTLGLDMDETLSVVAGAKVFEIQSTLGNLFFGHGVSAHATLALWARPVPDRFEPLVAEFGFSTHVLGTDKEKIGQEAADDFFKALQVPLKEYLSDGTTKTALIYGDAGA